MKKKLLFLLLPFVAAAWLAGLPGCRERDTSTTLRGKVVEYGTGTGVADAKIYLLCQSGPVFGGGTSNILDTFYTEADGSFYRHYEYEELCGGSYLFVYKDGYNKVDALAFHTGDNDLSITLDPWAWMKLRTIPSSTLSSTWIDGDFYGTSINCYGFEGDTTRLLRLLGNREYIIRWGHNWQNFNEYEHQKIVCPGHDTTSFTIHY